MAIRVGAERAQAVEQRAGGGDDRDWRALGPEHLADLVLGRAVVARALRHQRDEAGGGDDVAARVGELGRRAAGLLVHRAQLLRRHLAHAHAARVEREALVGRLGSRARSSAGISVSIVTLELGTIRPKR